MSKRRKRQTFIYVQAIGKRKSNYIVYKEPSDQRPDQKRPVLCAINTSCIAYFFPVPYSPHITKNVLKNGDHFLAYMGPRCFADLIEEKQNDFLMATSNETSNDKTTEILNKLKELLELSESDPLAKESQILYDHVKWTIQEALDDTSRIHENDQSRAESKREQRTEKSTSGLSERICSEEESSDER